jgi:hypothetical protein
MVGESAVWRQNGHIPRLFAAHRFVLLSPAELLNIFDVFLPQLLIYPNAAEYVANTLASLDSNTAHVASFLMVSSVPPPPIQPAQWRSGGISYEQPRGVQEARQRLVIYIFYFASAHLFLPAPPKCQHLQFSFIPDYVKRFATEEGIAKAEEGSGGAAAGGGDDEDDEDLSSVGSMDSDDDAADDMDL